MKKVVVLLLMVTWLSVVSSCGSSEKKYELSDFCGQKAERGHTARSGPGGAECIYSLTFKNPGGVGVIDIEVSEANYSIYKDGRPIDCSKK